jgi:hypothetical protein
MGQLTQALALVSDRGFFWVLLIVLHLTGVEMNVGELKKKLEQYPDDMEILHTMMSDYDLLSESDFSVVEAVRQGYTYVMRSHRTMSADNVARAKKYLHIRGN